MSKEPIEMVKRVMVDEFCKMTCQECVRALMRYLYTFDELPRRLENGGSFTTVQGDSYRYKIVIEEIEDNRKEDYTEDPQIHF